jgi:hypothetical protein
MFAASFAAVGFGGSPDFDAWTATGTDAADSELRWSGSVR